MKGLLWDTTQDKGFGVENQSQSPSMVTHRTKTEDKTHSEVAQPAKALATKPEDLS